MDYLIKRALSEVWNSPKQDNQIIIKLARLTPSNGAINYFNYFGRKIDLPTIVTSYHVYNIGRINPSLLGLLYKAYYWDEDLWSPITNAINLQNVVVMIYDSNGFQIPIDNIRYCVTKERGLIFSILEDDTYLSDLNRDIFIRFYTNQFFNTVTYNQTVNTMTDRGIYTQVATVDDSQALINIIETHKELMKKPGYSFLLVNGIYKETVDTRSLNRGDKVSLIYDESIKRVIDFNLSTLRSFNSELDSKWKYLLHYKGQDNNTIDYVDDIDIYVCFPDNRNVINGLYYNKNNKMNQRMVTHRDYSILEENVRYLIDVAENITGSTFTNDQITIKLLIREGGIRRPLIYDNNRIFELYKIDDFNLYSGYTETEENIENRLLNTISGVNSNVKEWTASELEKSNYCLLMGYNEEDINLEMAVGCYGYNSISSMLGYTPNKETVDGSGIFELPLIGNKNSTIYEYDNIGRLLRSKTHSSGPFHTTNDTNCKLIECIAGIGSSSPSLFYTDSVNIKLNIGFKLYGCLNDSDLANEVWHVVSKDKLVYSANSIDCNIISSGYKYYILRYEDQFLDLTKTIKSENGVLRFQMTEYQNRAGVLEEVILTIPFGELDVFSDSGESLIDGIDYHYENNNVVIYSLDRLKQPFDTAEQKIRIRFTGFCNDDLNRTKNEEKGFIEHGVLSNNERFDVRDDKVLRIIIDGKLTPRENVLFSESHTGVSVLNARNGLPYAIKDIVVPITPYTDKNTYELRDTSRDLDKRISDYLSTIIPQPMRNAVSVIQKKYDLVSPFLSALTYDIMTGVIKKEDLANKNITLSMVVNIGKKYEPYLTYEPLFENKNNIDKRFVLVRPHPYSGTVQISLGQFKLIRLIVDNYFDSSIEITPFYTINGE